MSDSVNKNDLKELKYASGASGVTGGTALALFANSLPAESWYRTALVIAAPTLTVILSKLVDNIPKWYAEWKKGRNYKNAYKDTRKQLISIIKNPNTSDEVRKKLTEEVENLDMAYAHKLVRIVVES